VPHVSDVDSTLRLPSGAKTKSDDLDGQLTGNFHFALKAESGNSDQTEIDLDFYLHYKEGARRYHVYGQFEYDLRNGENSKQDWQIYPTYDYFLSEKFYASLAYSAKQEKFAGLDLRQSFGPSLGYEFYSGKPVSLKTTLGFYFVKEEYADKDASQYFGPVWNLEYKYDLFGGKMQLYHRHYSSVSTKEIEKFLWHSWTGINVPLAKGIVVSSEIELNYDGQPALKAESLDATLRLKVGYEW
jgi:putative salt-induced outer membrane protein YdiY